MTGMLISMERHSIGAGKSVNVALADYQGYRVMIPVTEMNIIHFFTPINQTFCLQYRLSVPIR